MHGQDERRFFIFHDEGALLSIKRDIYLLHRHLDFVKSAMAEQREIVNDAQRESEQQKINKNLRDIDVLALQINVQQREAWLQQSTPQIIVNPFVVATWSLYESVLRDFADVLQEKKRLSKNLSDITGKHFVARVKRYFNHTLQHPLQLTSAREQKLRILSDTRNVIVHHYGRFNNLRPELQKAIETGDVMGASHSEETGKLILGVKFAEEVFSVTRDHLLQLLNEFQDIEAHLRSGSEE